MLILRDPEIAPPSGGTVSASVQLPVVKAPDTTKTSTVNLPKEIADMEFSGVEDFIPEQLPEQGTDTTKVKVEEKKIEKTKEEPKTVEKIDEVKKIEEKKEEAKPLINPLDKLTKAPGQKKEESKVGEVKPITPPARDYSAYTPQETTALKQMSNEGFELASRLIKENKDLGKLKETTYLQHPDAYTLDPQYKQMREDAFYANKEAQYWKEQLVNMDTGADFVPIVGWNNDGSAKLGTPRKPTKMDEENCRIAVMNCSNVISQLQSRLQQYPQKYKQSINTDLQAINNYRRNQFGWVADQKYLDNVVNVEGLGERSLRQIRDDIKSMLPVYMQSHPLAEVLGDLVIGIRLKEHELSELRNTKAVETVKQQEQDLVEPSSNGKQIHKGKGERVHGVDEFKVEGDLGIG